MDNLWKQWSAFIGVVFQPFNLLLLVGLWWLFHISGTPDSGVSPDLMFVLITLAAAVLGGRVAQQWAAVTEEGNAETRGRLAVRNLKLLLRNIAALETRLSVFRKDEKQITDNPEVTKRNYDEAIGLCVQLEEETVNSIENWTDIVPEANITTQIGRISQLQADLGKTERELMATRDSLQQAKGQSEEVTARLRAGIKTLETEKERLAKELRDKSFGLGSLNVGSAKPLSDLLGITSSGIVTTLKENPSALTITTPNMDGLKITLPDSSKITK